MRRTSWGKSWSEPDPHPRGVGLEGPEAGGRFLYPRRLGVVFWCLLPSLCHACACATRVPVHPCVCP